MKNKIQSRREFFKKAAKAALPVVGAAILSSVPFINAEAAPSGCGYTCSGGCSSSCRGTCDIYCTGCYGSCKGTCHITCTGDCKGTSYQPPTFGL